MLSKKISLYAFSLAISIFIQSCANAASINAGDHGDSASYPFKVQSIAEFDHPWSLAFLPNGKMLITEKPGEIFLVDQAGVKIQVGNVPAVENSGQNGLLDVAIAPGYKTNSEVYFSFIAPENGGSRLELARAKLTQPEASKVSLTDISIIWKQTPSGGGGQPGGIIAFSPSGKYLFLTVGDRMQSGSAQDLNQARGKIIRLNLDGSIPADNPFVSLGNPASEVWTSGHRNPYGLAFSSDGQLWSHEMGPKGGDEFNLIEKGNNYGWPVVSNGDNYSGIPIPRHSNRPDLTAPPLYWTPVISPAGLVFYHGVMFPQWENSALIGGLSSRSLIRIGFNETGQPNELDRWRMGARIRDVVVSSDGAVWVIEDGSSGRLLRLTPNDLSNE